LVPVSTSLTYVLIFKIDPAIPLANCAPDDPPIAFVVIDNRRAFDEPVVKL